jgi:hypothetical protein
VAKVALDLREADRAWNLADNPTAAAFVSCWHLTDKPITPAFVAYWTNSGQRVAPGLSS